MTLIEEYIIKAPDRQISAAVLFNYLPLSHTHTHTHKNGKKTKQKKQPWLWKKVPLPTFLQNRTYAYNSLQFTA